MKPMGKRKIISVFLMIVIMLSVCCVGCNSESGKNSTTEQEALSNETAEVLVFPYVVDDGKLEITSVFQYSGINPDYGNEEGTDIASIMVKNVSDTYLESAEITLNSSDGSEFNFLIEELPAGKVVMAFSKENASSEVDTSINNVICETIYSMDASMCEDKVSVAIDGTKITLKNSTNAEINELVVYCRSTLGEEYFGGITYKYTINNLPANGTAELDALECILGLADVVRIAINE